MFRQVKINWGEKKMKIPHSMQQHAKFHANPQNTFTLKSKGKNPHKRGLNDRLLQPPYYTQLLNVAPLHWSRPRAKHKQWKPLLDLLGTMHSMSFKQLLLTLKNSSLAFQPGSSQYCKASWCRCEWPTRYNTRRHQPAWTAAAFTSPPEASFTQRGRTQNKNFNNLALGTI